jgi:pSer/pThr/pTyr-binding forkhead associated (FHA) protein
MQLVLEATAGPHQGRKIVVRTGQTATFGRTERAEYTFPLDEQMSGLHFSLEYAPPDCRIRDLGSANGTFLGSSRVQDAAMHPSDTIRAGRTVFSVTFPPPVVETEPIPDYLKHIVPPGARIRDYNPEPSAGATSFGGNPSGAILAPQPVVPDISFAPPPMSLPAEQTYEPSRLSSSLSGTLRLEVEVVGGPHLGARFSLRSGDSLQVGRTDLADFVLARDVHLSGLHFAVRSSPQGFEISDLGSTSGTYVNDETVAAALLADGDVIRAGDSRFKVRLEGAAATPLPAVPRGDGLPFAEGVRDPDLHVRREALIAVAWTGQTWLMAHCRKLAETAAAEDWDAIALVAILGKPAELSRVEALSRAEALGPRRLLLVGAYGNPALVDTLLERISGGDPVLAAVAGLAFAKITGADIASPQRVELILEEGGPPSDLFLPDVKKALAHWKNVHSNFAASTRVCRGFDLSGQISDAVFSELDMESRWEARLRGRYCGTWQGSLRDL